MSSVYKCDLVAQGTMSGATQVWANNVYPQGTGSKWRNTGKGKNSRAHFFIITEQGLNQRRADVTHAIYFLIGLDLVQ